MSGNRAPAVEMDILSFHKQNKAASSGRSCVSLENPTEYRPVQREESDFSMYSGLTMKSEQSVDYPEVPSRETDHQELKQIHLRGLSVKSEQSMDYPNNFSRETDHTEMKQSHPRGLSMKSEQSMDFPNNFSRETIPTEPKQIHLRGLSVKSEQSMDYPNNFSRETDYTEMKQGHPRGLSMKSEQSMDYPNNFSRETIPTEPYLYKARKPQSSSSPSKVSLVNQPWTTQLPFKDETPKHRIKQKESRSNGLNENQSWRCQYRKILQNKCQCIFEGNEEHSSPSLLNNIYTELYITDGESSEHNSEHEIQQIEMVSKNQAMWDAQIHANDIFTAPGSTKQIKTVLTKGIAGIGKTVSVQKFTLDWLEDRANQDVHMIFLLPFREMNGFKERRISLIQILQCLFNLEIDAEVFNSDKYKIVFIFDGLDECRFPLDFQNNRSCSSVTESILIGVLLTNLICRNLLPSALVWITSRPAAAGQIPLEIIDRVTEVQGFNDSHKEEYFIKRIRDPDLSSRIISHLKTSKILHIMCHIPVFCWISATVLEKMFRDSEGGEIPKTLTQMYTHFLILQIKQGSHKYNENPKAGLKWDNQTTLLLGKLAFQELEKGNLLFYEDDLKECGIEVDDASVYSGVCTQVFREEEGLLQEKVFSFVHASIQEFLAALYVFLVFITNKQNVLSQSIKSTLKKLSLHSLLKCAVDKALASDNGHLDLFLRFLLGLSLESNQTLLRGLLMSEVLNDTESNTKTLQYIKDKIRDQPSAEKAISLLHCLSELKDDSLIEDVQKFINSNSYGDGKLSPSRFSALAYILLTSAKELDVFNLAKFINPSMTSDEGILRLLPVIKVSRSVLLRCCNVTEKGCAGLASVLSSNHSCLKELDLSSNNLQDSGIIKLAVGLGNPQCKLETLRLFNCSISEEGCASLASALRSNPSHLIKLDLMHNNPQDAGVKIISNVLTDTTCKLETLRLMGCGLTKKSCAALAEVLKSCFTSLKNLDISLNDLQDSGVKILCDGLKNPSCKLEKLSLSDCKITAEGCSALSSALKSNPSHLKELDLGINNLTDSGLKDLLPAMEDPNVHLERLWLNNCSLTYTSCQMMGSVNTSKHSHLKELNLSANDLLDSGLKYLSLGLCHLLSGLQSLSVTYCGITAQGCDVLASALSSKQPQLRALDLRGNHLLDSGVKLLSELLEDPNCKLKELKWKVRKTDRIKTEKPKNVGCDTQNVLLQKKHQKKRRQRAKEKNKNTCATS